jgi:hypothetical protein
MPVYDKHVRDNLSLATPKPHEPPERRVEKFLLVYADLQAKQKQPMGSDEFPRLRRAFDARFAAYAHFTDTKKLDLLLWQYREP